VVEHNRLTPKEHWNREAGSKKLNKPSTFHSAPPGNYHRDQTAHFSRILQWYEVSFPTFLVLSVAECAKNGPFGRDGSCFDVKVSSYKLSHSVVTGSAMIEPFLPVI
jgi:hypothetical protein